MAFYQSKPDWDETGRMRHIGLAKGDVAPVVLMPGDPGRCEVMQNLFASSRYIGQRGAFATYTGKTPGGADISVMSSGMGCMNVSLALEELSHLGVKNGHPGGHRRCGAVPLYAGYAGCCHRLCSGRGRVV